MFSSFRWVNPLEMYESVFSITMVEPLSADLIVMDLFFFSVKIADLSSLDMLDLVLFLGRSSNCSEILER